MYLDARSLVSALTCAAAALSAAAVAACATAATPVVAFSQLPGRVDITVDGEPAASYFYDDDEITRPYFARLKAPGGTQASRNHPPIEGVDDTDHGVPGKYFHPGAWLAFSDVNGNDYWRLKAPVRHEGFVEAPCTRSGSFTVHNTYRDQQRPEEVVFDEVCRCAYVALPEGRLLIHDSVFTPRQGSLRFGDEEEMGFGFRAATPMAVKHGGRMVDSAGREGEEGIWSREAAWCDTCGRVEGRLIGAMLVPDAANCRPSRMHARDTGFFAVNPIGRRVFGESDDGSLVVAPGEELRLRFALLLHAHNADEDVDLPTLAAVAARRMAAEPRPVAFRSAEQ